MNDRYFYTVVRVIILSLFVLYQILNYVFWRGSNDINGPYSIISLSSPLFYILAIGGFIFPIVTMPLLFAINKNGDKEWRMVKDMYVKPPSFNDDLFGLKNILTTYQDSAYMILACGLPNFLLYLIFERHFNIIGVGCLSSGLGGLIGIQLVLRFFHGKY